MTEILVLRSDAVANRQRVITAARAVFAERGFAAEMKEIADRAGLGVGTIYRNFATKDDLVAALVEEIVTEALAQLRDVMTIPDPRERLRTMLEMAWHKVQRDGALMLALCGERDLDPHCQSAPPDELVNAIVGTIREGQASGAFRRDLAPEFVAYYLIAQFPAYLALARLMPPAEVHANLERFILGGLSPRASVEAG